MKKIDLEFIKKEISKIYFKETGNLILTKISTMRLGNIVQKKDTTFFFVVSKYFLVGFAVWFEESKIIRFYNKEGEDCGIITNVVFNYEEEIRKHEKRK